MRRISHLVWVSVSAGLKQGRAPGVSLGRPLLLVADQDGKRASSVHQVPPSLSQHWPGHKVAA
jgi:hypothetical protein